MVSVYHNLGVMSYHLSLHFGVTEGFAEVIAHSNPTKNRSNRAIRCEMIRQMANKPVVKLLYAKVKLKVSAL